MSGKISAEMAKTNVPISHQQLLEFTNAFNHDKNGVAT